MPDEMTRTNISRRVKEHTIDTLQRMISEDLSEAVSLGLLTKDEAFDVAIKAALDWKSN